RSIFSIGPLHSEERKRGDQKPGGFPILSGKNAPEQTRRYNNEPQHRQQHREYKPQSKTWQERGTLRRTYNSSERSRHDIIRSARPSREHSHPYQRNLPGPPPQEATIEKCKEGYQSISKNNPENDKRGTPLLEDDFSTIPHETLNKARVEVRDVMLQYTKCADPTEREARKERVRQAEERGQMGDAALQLARSALVMKVVEQEVAPNGTPERLPASQRLCPNTHDEIVRPEQSMSDHNSNSRERLPASSRLGEKKSPTSLPRRPVTSRLEPVEILVNVTLVEEAAIVKRKPGRPPGRRKVAASPKTARSSLAKKRKSGTAPSCRKQLNTVE
ncbi:hypothetical protein HID58_076960, partial [Brassica napus]